MHQIFEIIDFVTIYIWANELYQEQYLHPLSLQLFLLLSQFLQLPHKVLHLLTCLSSDLWCSPRWLLKQEVSKIVKSINRQLREKSIKTKVLVTKSWYLIKLSPDFKPGCLCRLVPSLFWKNSSLSCQTVLQITLGHSFQESKKH